MASWLHNQPSMAGRASSRADTDDRLESPLRVRQRAPLRVHAIWLFARSRRIQSVYVHLQEPPRSEHSVSSADYPATGRAAMIADQHVGPEVGVAVRFFDAHCDTIAKVLAGTHDFNTGSGTGQVSLPGLREAGSCAQIFACFVLEKWHPKGARTTANRIIRAIVRMVQSSDGNMEVIRSAPQLARVCGDGSIGAIIAMEGADPLEGCAEALRDFWELGVRSLILAWGDNPFSGTAFGRNTPLTAEGRKLVSLAEDLHVMIDVSHLSDRAFADVKDISRAPFIASHSNCRALCASPRNLSDAMIRQLANRGGVMGINLYSGFLDPEFLRLHDQPLRARILASGTATSERRALALQLASFTRPTLDWVARHVLHAVNVGGEDCIGIGGDLDGIMSLPVGVDSVSDYPKIVDCLGKVGLSAMQIEKVCYRNFMRAFSAILPGKASEEET